MKIQFQALNRQSADHISRVCWRTDHNQILQTHFKSGLKCSYWSTICQRHGNLFLLFFFARICMSQTSTVVKSQRNCDVWLTNNGQESATQFFAPSWVPQTSELHSILCTKLGSANIRTALNSLHQVGFRKHPNCTQFFAPS